MYLRALAESDGNNEVLDILGRSTVDSTVLLTKAAIVFGKEMSVIKMTKDLRKKLELYKKSLKEAQAMRKAANKIPPDGVADYVWKMISTPWWSTAYKYANAAADDEQLTTMTKDSTVAKFDMVIDYIKKQIAELKKKVKVSNEP